MILGGEQLQTDNSPVSMGKIFGKKNFVTETLKF